MTTLLIVPNSGQVECDHGIIGNCGHCLTNIENISASILAELLRRK